MRKPSRALVVALVLAAAPAQADNTGYRSELILVDGVAAGTLGTGIAFGTWVFSSDDFHLPIMIGAFGGTGLVLGGPIVHARHGHLGRGAASFALRVLTPAVVAATMVTAAGLDEDDERYGGYFGGGLALGAGVAVALDWWLLVPDAPARAADQRPSPMVAPVAGGGVLGVAGAW